MSKQPEMVIARNSRATRNNDTTLNLDNQMNPQTRIPGANQCACAHLCKGKYADKRDRTNLIVPQERRLKTGH